MEMLIATSCNKHFRKIADSRVSSYLINQAREAQFIGQLHCKMGEMGWVLAAAWFQAFFAVDEDGDWPYVVDLDQHVLPEAAAFHFKSGSAQELDECLDQGLCFLWGSCISETGAATLACISQEGELAHY